MRKIFNLFFLMIFLSVIILASCQQNSTTSTVPDENITKNGSNPTVPAYQSSDGQAVFLNNNCNDCHSVSSKNITGIKNKSVDLTGVGSISGMSTDFLISYLSKDGKFNGKKHQGIYKGTSLDLSTIASWLMTL